MNLVTSRALVDRAHYLFVLAAAIALAASVQAQTRLSPPQMPALNGPLTRTYSNVILRDINSARDHGDGLFTGIANGIVDCGTTISCSILVPPTYSLVEPVPGYAFDPTSPSAAATTPPNVNIFDRRIGDGRMAVNSLGYNIGLINTLNGWVYDYYAQAQPAAVLNSLYLLQNSWDGGNNQSNSALSYADKTQWTPLNLKNNSYTPGQHVTTGLTTFSASVGDVVAVSNHVYCSGGLNTQGDVGCRGIDNQVMQGSVEYAGTLTGSGGLAATTLSVQPTQGNATQGSARYLIKTNAGTIAAGSISNIATGSYVMTSLTGSGTAWPVSTVVAQLGTAVTSLGASTVTPTNFTTGAMSGITTNTMVCLADPSSFETVYPTAVTSTGFTATFSKVHFSYATISVGGVCGYLMDLTADDVTNSTYSVHQQTITGTLHFAWPMVYSTSASSAVMWVAGGGAYQQLVSRWNAASANGYVLYPFAEVLSVQQGGGLSNTLTLAPNNVAWTPGDSVSELLYPAINARAGNNVVEAYYPNLAPDSHNFSFTYNSPLTASDSMLTLANNAPTSFYSSSGGKLTSPYGIHLQGQTNYGLFFDTPSDQWTLGVGCNAACNSSQNIFAANNPAYYDFLQYDEANTRWSISASSNSYHYVFGSDRLYTPMPNLYLSGDSNGVGYLATQSVRSGVATNTDISGELALTNAASATYTFLGVYGSHPECTVKPQMDIGAANRHWITYSGTTSFTLNFGTTVTGAISYSCVGRN